MLEYLATHPEGVPLAQIADALDVPRSATHRLLSELGEQGYVRQVRQHGDYVLTTKLSAVGLTFLSKSGIVDLAQPILDRLAEASGEFVRMAVLDSGELTWVAKAQGARKGLRYDPEMGVAARLSCTASGQAWLMSMSDDEALAKVAAQGFGQPKDYGPNAVTTPEALLAALKLARSRGFTVTQETFTVGMAAMAAPVRTHRGDVVGVLSVAGPVARFTETAMLALGPELLQATHELASSGSSIFMQSSSVYPDVGHPVLVS